VALWIFLRAFSSSGTTTGGSTRETTGHVWDGDLQEYNNPLPRWWLNLFYITLAFGALYLVLYPGLGDFAGLFKWTQETAYNEEIAAAEQAYGPLFNQYLQQDLKTVAADPKANAIGKRLFATYCANCHGADAGGGRGFPNLRDGDWLYGGDPQAIEATIANGREAVMPAWSENLSQQDIGNVADYLVSLSRPGKDNAAAKAGEQVFTTNCAACHQANAHGLAALGAPNLSDDVWLYGGSRERIVESITKGRHGKMPAHGELLGKGKVHVLAAYVYGLSNFVAPGDTAAK
jgi:cytochrome c oxidase cbb3-type subunit 3